jgi:hypothetical protein
MNTPSTPTTPRQGSELARALAAAQASIKAIPHDAQNQFMKYRYTSSESIIAECKNALAANGLALMPAGQSITVTDGQILLVRQFTLLHTSGEERQLSTAWPIVPDKGRPADKATASAATTSLAYLLRDLLLAPRVDPADDLAGREDRPAKKEKPKVIGADGSKRLLDMAKRKGVQLADYLAEPGAPLAGLSQEVAREVWRKLQSLPDPQPATSPQPVSSGPLAATGNNGNTGKSPTSRVPF